MAKYQCGRFQVNQDNVKTQIGTDEIELTYVYPVVRKTDFLGNPLNGAYLPSITKCSIDNAFPVVVEE